MTTTNKVKRCSLSYTHLEECDGKCGGTTVSDFVREALKNGKAS